MASSVPAARAPVHRPPGGPRGTFLLPAVARHRKAPAYRPAVPGRLYAVNLPRGGTVAVEPGSGRCGATWFNPPGGGTKGAAVAGG